MHPLFFKRVHVVLPARIELASSGYKPPALTIELWKLGCVDYRQIRPHTKLQENGFISDAMRVI